MLKDSMAYQCGNKRKKRVMSIVLCFIMLSVVFTPQVPVFAATSAYTMTVSDTTVSDFRVGFGWNTHYSHGEMYQNFTDTAWTNFFNIYKWSGVDWTRKEFIVGDAIEPINDNADPNTFNWSAFVHSQSYPYNVFPTWIEKSLKFDKDNSIDVMAVNWHNTSSWNGGSDSGNAPTSASEFGENIAAALKMYYTDKGYNNIKWLSIWNEPDWHFYNATYPGDFSTLYSAVTSKLASVGLDDNIGYAGPDVTNWYGSLNGLGTIFDNCGTNIYSLICDHDYAYAYNSSIDGPEATVTLNSYSSAMDYVHSRIGSSHPPMVLAEQGPAYAGYDIPTIYSGQLADAEAICRLSQMGYEGFCPWSFNINNMSWPGPDCGMAWYALKRADGYDFEPNAAVLYPRAVISRYARKNWQVKQITNESGGMVGSYKKVSSTAFKSGTNKTIVLVNNSSSPVGATVNISTGFGSPASFNYVYVNSGTSGIIDGGTVNVSSNQFTVTLPAKSINTFTTLAKGDLDEPESWKWAAPNQTLNKPATASTTYGSGYEASKAADGNPATRWASVNGQSNPEWLYVDLLSSQNVNRVVLKWADGYATSYKIQTSNDLVNWTDQYSTTTGDGGTDDISLSPVCARYVRMYGTAKINPSWGYTLWDMEAYSAPPVSTNLALNKTVACSTSYGAGYEASKAVDGNSTTTRWASVNGQSNPEWLRVDLGSVKNINRVVLKWADGYATSYKIQTSNDAVNWTDRYLIRNGNGQVDDISFPQVSARYVRMYGTEKINQNWGYTLWEMEVYSPPPTGPNLALNKTATNSTSYGTGYEASKAVDGNSTTTRWASVNGQSDPEWLRVDLGSAQTISRVILKWSDAYATSYKIQTSNNAVDWTDSYVTTSDGWDDDITFSPVSARYIRMYGMSKIYQPWGYSLWEMEVY